MNVPFWSIALSLIHFGKLIFYPSPPLKNVGGLQRALCILPLRWKVYHFHARIKNGIYLWL